MDEDKIRSFLQVARSKRNFPLSVDTPIKELLTHLDLIDENDRIANGEKAYASISDLSWRCI